MTENAEYDYMWIIEINIHHIMYIDTDQEIFSTNPSPPATAVGTVFPRQSVNNRSLRRQSCNQQGGEKWREGRKKHRTGRFRAGCTRMAVDLDRKGRGRPAGRGYSARSRR